MCRRRCLPPCVVVVVCAALLAAAPCGARRLADAIASGSAATSASLGELGATAAAARARAQARGAAVARDGYGGAVVAAGGAERANGTASGGGGSDISAGSRAAVSAAARLPRVKAQVIAAAVWLRALIDSGGPVGRIGPVDITNSLRSRLLAGLGTPSVRPWTSLVPPGMGWDLVAMQQLGEGAFAKVWKAMWVVPGLPDKPVAVKLMSRWKRKRWEVRREGSIMTLLRGHHSFLNFYGWWRERDVFVLVMELADGDMRSMLNLTFAEFRLRERLRLFAQLLDGLQRMASVGLIHRDIWSGNLFIIRERGGLRLTIGDFGQSCSLPGGPEEFRLRHGELRTCVGTFSHRSAEAWRLEWGPKNDVFSAGMVLYELLFGGRMPLLYYQAYVQANMYWSEEALIQWQRFDISKDPIFLEARRLAEETQDPGFTQILALLEGMLARHHSQRMSAAEARAELAQLQASNWRPHRAQELASTAAAIFESELQSSFAAHAHQPA